MKINATLLVQIINLLITYFVLHMLLFKSAIASLREKKEKQNTLESSIKKEEDILLALEKEKDENLVQFQVKVGEKYPFISPLHYEKPTSMPHIKEQAMDTGKLEKEVIKLLVEKVPHAY